jgi:hypothetical protein
VLLGLHCHSFECQVKKCHPHAFYVPTALSVLPQFSLSTPPMLPCRELSGNEFSGTLPALWSSMKSLQVLCVCPCSIERTVNTHAHVPLFWQGFSVCIRSTSGNCEYMYYLCRSIVHICSTTRAISAFPIERHNWLLFCIVAAPSASSMSQLTHVRSCHKRSSIYSYLKPATELQFICITCTVGNLYIVPVTS